MQLLTNEALIVLSKLSEPYITYIGDVVYNRFTVSRI